MKRTGYLVKEINKLIRLQDKRGLTNKEKEQLAIFEKELKEV